MGAAEGVIDRGPIRKNKVVESGETFALWYKSLSPRQKILLAVVLAAGGGSGLLAGGYEGLTLWGLSLAIKTATMGASSYTLYRSFDEWAVADLDVQKKHWRLTRGVHALANRSVTARRVFGLAVGIGTAAILYKILPTWGEAGKAIISEGGDLAYAGAAQAAEVAQTLSAEAIAAITSYDGLVMSINAGIANVDEKIEYINNLFDHLRLKSYEYAGPADFTTRNPSLRGAWQEWARDEAAYQQTYGALRVRYFNLLDRIRAHTISFADAKSTLLHIESDRQALKIQNIPWRERLIQRGTELCDQEAAWASEQQKIHQTAQHAIL